MDYRDPFFWLKRRAVKAFLDNLGPIAVVVLFLFFWLKRMAVKAFLDNLGPIAVVVLFLVAFMALGYIEVTI